MNTYEVVYPMLSVVDMATVKAHKYHIIDGVTYFENIVGVETRTYGNPEKEYTYNNYETVASFTNVISVRKVNYDT